MRDENTSIYSEAFESQGFSIVGSAITAEQVALVEAGLDAIRLDAAGTRNLLPQPWCRGLVDTLKSHDCFAHLFPAQSVAAQCTLFEKSSDRNWLVPLHQDVHIPVRERLDHPLLSGWSRKEGALYVQPPVEVLENLVALRVHIDDCGPGNGPLRLVPCSHLSGRLSGDAISALRATQGERLCIVARGGVLAMRPLLLHASSKATHPNRRRVLHFLFGPQSLPLGLSWGSAA